MEEDDGRTARGALSIQAAVTGSQTGECGRSRSKPDRRGKGREKERSAIGGWKKGMPRQDTSRHFPTPVPTGSGAKGMISVFSAWHVARIAVPEKERKPPDAGRRGRHPQWHTQGLSMPDECQDGDGRGPRIQHRDESFPPILAGAWGCEKSPHHQEDIL